VESEVPKWKMIDTASLLCEAEYVILYVDNLEEERLCVSMFELPTSIFIIGSV
jgi:hypothetical protein